jgi:hypothetical protein
MPAVKLSSNSNSKPADLFRMSTFEASSFFMWQKKQSIFLFAQILFRNLLGESSLSAFPKVNKPIA